MGQPPHRRPRELGDAALVPRGHRALRAAVRGRSPRSSRTTCTRTTSRPSTRSSATASSSSASSTTTPTSPPAWPSTARRARRSAPIFDGTGYGTDGTVWGGELLVATCAASSAPGTCGRCGCRAATRAVREPWRMACAWLAAARRRRRRRRRALAGGSTPRAGRRSRGAGRAAGVAAPVTTSMGRLFDAVAALCGLRTRGHLRGPGGDRARGRLRDPASAGAYPLPCRRRCSTPAPAVLAAAADVAAGVPVGRRRRPLPRRGRRGHRGRRAPRSPRGRGLDVVVLSRRRVPEPRAARGAPPAALRAAGLRVLVPRAPAAERRRDRLRAGGRRRRAGRRCAPRPRRRPPCSLPPLGVGARRTATLPAAAARGGARRTRPRPRGGRAGVGSRP